VDTFALDKPVELIDSFDRDTAGPPLPRKFPM